VAMQRPGTASNCFDMASFPELVPEWGRRIS
jgi:hypothetical protein